MKEEGAPCRNCRGGLHRLCRASVPIPTILGFLRLAEAPTTETVTCCDREEIWTQAVQETKPVRLTRAELQGLR